MTDTCEDDEEGDKQATADHHLRVRSADARRSARHPRTRELGRSVRRSPSPDCGDVARRLCAAHVHHRAGAPVGCLLGRPKPPTEPAAVR